MTPVTDLFGNDVEQRMNTSTSIVFILDRSGSMNSIWDSTVEGFREFLNGQRAVEGNVYLTLVVFDDVVETVYVARPISSVDDDILERYRPRGMTALFDGVARGLREHRERIELLPIEERPTTHIAVVATDGGENASRDTTRESVVRLIDECETDGYQVIFIGAGTEGWASGTNLGFSTSSSINYQPTANSTSATWTNLSNDVVTYRVARNSAAEVGDVSTFYSSTLNLTANVVDDDGNIISSSNDDDDSDSGTIS